MKVSSYIKQALVLFGLTEGEVKVYLTFLQDGVMDAATIKQKTRLSTAGVYKITESLISKGFISYVDGSYPLSYISVPLHEISRKFANQGRKMSRIADKFSELGRLSTIPVETDIYEGNSLTDYYLNIPYKIDDAIWCVGSFGACVGFMGKDTEKTFIKTRIKKGGQASAIIFDETDLSRELAGRDRLEKRETKFIHNGEYPMEFSYLFGNSYLNFYKDAENKIKVLKIDSPELAKAKLIQYQMLWNSTK